MAHLYRLVVVAGLGLLLCLTPWWARAETIPATPTGTVTQPSTGWLYQNTAISCAGVVRFPASGFVHTTLQAAADAVTQQALNYASRATWGTQYCDDPLGTAVRGVINQTNLTLGYQVIWNGQYQGPASIVFSRISGACPSGWQTSGSNCTQTTYTCPSTGGWTLNGSTCTREPACNEYTGRTYSAIQLEVAAQSMTMCVDAYYTGTMCEVRSQTMVAQGVDGRHWMYPPIVYTGQPCETVQAPVSGTPVETLPPGIQPPPPGTCPGTVNGASVNLPCSTTTTDSTTTTKGPSSTASSPSGTTPGTSSTTSTTTCTGAGSCVTTTTTVVNNPDGTTTTSTEDKTQSKGDFCTANSGNAQCKDQESTFGGTCAATTCTGDAIQCAMAKEQAKRMCELMDTPNELSSVGTAAMTGTNPTDHPRNEVQEQAINLASMINSAPLFGTSGACPADVPFTHQGFSFTLPFSSWCPYLQLLGAAWLAACYLAAGFIVFKKGD